MSLQNVLSIVKERGLTLALGDDGLPRVRGKVRSEGTAALLDALKAYRREIIEHLGGTVPPELKEPTTRKRREWLWATGHRYVEYLEDAMPADASPAGAWWWRLEGEPDWLPVPGRNPDGVAPPSGETVRDATHGTART